MLIHFTKSIESLDSIVRKGFLYLHNETGVLGPAAREAFNIEADCQSSGMICFTELPSSETRNHQSIFGKFGLGVSKKWLLGKNARKVTYVSIGSTHYKSVVATLKLLAPKTLWGVPTLKYLEAAETRFMGAQALTNTEWALQAGASYEYIAFLKTLDWMQTDRDTAQREWRVRNPKPYRFLGRPSRQKQIDLLVNCIYDANVPDEVDGLLQYTIDGTMRLACTGKLSLALHLPSEQIRTIFCPELFVPVVQNAIASTGLTHVLVNTSEDTD